MLGATSATLDRRLTTADAVPVDDGRAPRAGWHLPGHWGILLDTMPRSTSRTTRSLHWLRRLGRSLALVAQLLVVLVPLSEGHEERSLDPHVEAPRTMPHLGHHPTPCSACTLASMLGHVEEQPRLRFAVVAVPAIEPTFARTFAQVARARSNSSRAPPHST